MRRFIVAMFVCLYLSLVGNGSAHFLWIEPLTVADGSTLARLIFSDTPRPGARDLTAKFSRSKLWTRAADGQVSDLAFTRGEGENARTLVAKVPARNGFCVEASYDYGIYSRGSASALLRYFAKALPSDWRQRGKPFARSQRLDLDVVPNCRDHAISVEVLFHGKLAARQEVVVFMPGGEQRQFKTDDNGTVTFSAAPGKYFVRAGYVEADRGGELAGQHYTQTWNYCTASFVVEGGAAAATKASAAELLAAARKSRSVWTKGFPGFEADVAVTVDGEMKSGKIKIDSSGSVELTMPDGKPADWAREQFESMVQHRMPDGEVAERNVEFARDNLASPLGRKIVLGDDRESSYRIKDNVIMEVCRGAGPMRFTISVLEVEWNAENKYLPRSFVMNYFDSKSGELRESHAYRNEWQRVGAFDLPKRILEIACKGSSSRVLQLDLTDVKLLSK